MKLLDLARGLLGYTRCPRCAEYTRKWAGHQAWCQ